MRIVVPIKQVPETSAVKMDPETGTMVRDGVEAIVNPLDLYAIEVALEIRDRRDDGSEVVALTMGPPAARKAVGEAISMGVDSGVLISDKALAGADTWSTSYVLAAAIRKIGDFDLIICGERATDGDTGQVGPGIAAFLDLPIATYISKIECSGDDNCLLDRLVEEGCEHLEMELPAAVTVVKAIASPRLPTLRGKQRSRKIDIPVWGAADLDVESENLGLTGSPTRVVRIFRPQVTRECERIPAGDPDTIETAADRVIEFLTDAELI
ncbi:MAG: electron transfer flavoprotein subunit beta/FixA family protein [Phycisphaerae bacterium]|nr:electron transfer flavoprotein subunit beta/FixA family protein [Phycisphaerae bacterium]